ncbi:hypothetical protein [Brachyspira catarrhinii]|nr:hypothetical protein [Brachyspira catarrhinii]
MATNNRKQSLVNQVNRLKVQISQKEEKEAEKIKDNIIFKMASKDHPFDH